MKIEAAQIPPPVCLAACATALSNAWAGEGRGGARSAAAARMIRYRQPTIYHFHARTPPDHIYHLYH